VKWGIEVLKGILLEAREKILSTKRPNPRKEEGPEKKSLRGGKKSSTRVIIVNRKGSPREKNMGNLCKGSRKERG